MDAGTSLCGCVLPLRGKGTTNPPIYCINGNNSHCFFVRSLRLSMFSSCCAKLFCGKVVANPIFRCIFASALAT